MSRTGRRVRPRGETVANVAVPEPLAVDCDRSWTPSGRLLFEALARHSRQSLLPSLNAVLEDSLADVLAGASPDCARTKLGVRSEKSPAAADS